MIDDDVVDEIIEISKETWVRWWNPAETMWKLNFFAKTPQWKPFKKRIYNLKTKFTISTLKNTGKKMKERKWLYKFSWGEWGMPMSMHPRSWMKKLKKEWLLE